MEQEEVCRQTTRGRRKPRMGVGDSQMPAPVRSIHTHTNHINNTQRNRPAAAYAKDTRTARGGIVISVNGLEGKLHFYPFFFSCFPNDQRGERELFFFLFKVQGEPLSGQRLV